MGRFSNLSTGKKIGAGCGLGCGGLVLVIIALAALGVILDAAGVTEKSPSPTPIAKQTTPAASPASPSETAAAEPSASPSAAGFNEEETAYVAEFSTSATTMGEALATIGEISPKWPWNDEQTVQIAAALVVLRDTWSNWKTTDAPSDRFARFHDQWLSSLELFDRCAKKYIYGADNADVKAIAQAVALMNKASAKFTSAAAELDRLRAEAGE